jgi:hypothetical protein
MMDDVIRSAKGVNGQLELLDGRIRIVRKGVLSFLTQGLKGDKEIAISAITSIQWRKAGLLTNGYIQFGFFGGLEAKGGIFQATEDENTIMFNQGRQAEFEAIRNELQRVINARPSAGAASPTSAADEIKKLADLREQGILTNDEFETKKKQLLGL